MGTNKEGVSVSGPGCEDDGKRWAEGVGQASGPESSEAECHVTRGRASLAETAQGHGRPLGQSQSPGPGEESGPILVTEGKAPWTDSMGRERSSKR